MSNWTIKEKFNLPNSWEVFRLHDLTTLIVDGTHFTPNYIENGIPFLRVTDIQTKKIDFSGLKFISKEEHELLKLRCAPNKGDILLSKNGSIGIIKIIDWDWEFSIFVSLALIRTIKELNNHYLKYLLQSEIVWWQIKLRAKQGTVTNLHLEEIRELEIPKPALSEQRRIAQILSTADSVIEQTQAAIAKYKAIKQGLLHDLFTRGIDISTGKLRPKYEEAPELYKESKLGWIPREWEVEKLGAHFSLLRSGLSRLLSEQDIGLPVLISGNIQDNKLDFTSLKYWHEIDPQGADTKSYFLDKGDILLCFINSIDQIGKLAIYEGYFRPCIYTTNMFRIKASELAKPKFLYYLLCSHHVQDEIKAILKPAVNQASFTTKDFCKILVPIIPIKEQILIEKLTEKADSQIQSEQTYLNKLQKIKTGLMADLLSGKKRVSEL